MAVRRQWQPTILIPNHQLFRLTDKQDPNDDCTEREERGFDEEFFSERDIHGSHDRSKEDKRS